MKLRRHDVTLRELDGETVLLDLRTSTYLRSNAMGTFVLTLLEQHRSRPELVDAVVQRFDVPDSRAAQDLDSFLASLRDAGLLDEAS